MSLSPSTALQRRARYRRSRMRGGSIALALLLGLCLSLSGFSTAWAAGPQKTAAQAPASTPPLVYHGGLIQSSPEVLLDFWGPNWANSSGQSIITYIVGLFSNLSGGNYLNILRQYGVHNHVTLVPVQGADYYYNSTNPGNYPAFNGSDSDPAADNEMIHAIQVAGLDPLTSYPNLQVMIFPDTNAHYVNGPPCGWHNFDLNGSNVYSIIPYPDLNKCNLNNTTTGHTETDEIEAIATHEFAEAVTDPQPGSGWTSGTNENEIGDLCGGVNMPYTPPSGGGSTYTTQELWSNLAASPNGADNCATNMGNAYASPDYASPYSGQHTVSSTMVSEYKNFQSTLRDPLTEQEDVAGGGVIYFDGQNSCGGYVLPAGSDGSVGVTSGSAIYYNPSTGAGAHEVQGCIFHYYQSSAVGGPGNPNGLGFPVSDETSVTGGGVSGRVSYFHSQLCGDSGFHPYGSGSAIYWNNGAAHFVRGCIYDRYELACGDGTNLRCVDVLGLPASSEIALSGGAVSYFTANSGTLCNGGYLVSAGVTAGSGIYYNSAAGTHEVQGCIFQHYTYIGGPLSDLGYPTSDEHTIAGGWVSDFQGTPCGSQSWGHIFSSATVGVGTYEVDGCIDTAYIHTYGGPSGSFGWPISDEQGIGSGYVSTFQYQTCGQYGHAQIYSSSATGTHEVQGCIDNAYRLCGGAVGPLGFPLDDEHGVTNSNARVSDFQNGSIIYQYGVATAYPNSGSCP